MKEKNNMNKNFKLKIAVYPSGKISIRPEIIFEDKKLNKTFLDQFLYEFDNDFMAEEFNHIVNKEYDKMFFKDNGKNGIFTLSGDSVYLEVIDKQSTISDIYTDEDEPTPEDIPSITIPNDELIDLLKKYRTQAKEFRAKLPEMQKQEDERRLLDENTFGF